MVVINYRNSKILSEVGKGKLNKEGRRQGKMGGGIKGNEEPIISGRVRHETFIRVQVNQ